MKKYKDGGIVSNNPRIPKAPKDNVKEGKPQMSLLPMDILSELLVPAYEEGLQKYFRESWRLGFKMNDMMDACQRHLTKFFYEREDLDQETLEKYNIKKHHLGAALFCIISMYNTTQVNPGLDNRPKQIKKR